MLIGPGLRLGGLAFAIGAVLGPLREWLLAPHLGGQQAALLEAAVFAALLWWAAGRTIPRGLDAREALVAGAIALAVVLAAEAALGALFAATGLQAQRAPRGMAEQAPGLLLLAWLLVLPMVRRR
jgi:hypothetical protein